jgi:DNA polymerase elongation subunit (family B)
MKILLLDIETSPNTAYVWGLFNENIPLSRLVQSSRTLCWAAKWYGEKEVMFHSILSGTPRKMLREIHKLLDEADAVVHYNGTRFDIPILNKEFIKHGMAPPAPYKQIDLLRVARSRFKFASNKLDFVAQFLGVGAKTKNTNFELWIECMNRDEKAWREMEIYNRNDVLILEKVYDKMLPWIKTHPNTTLHEEGLKCPNCSCEKYQRRGFAYTQLGKYRRYQCKGCGNWFRGIRTEAPKPSERFVNV